MRFIIGRFNFSVKQKIGNYGPFYLDNHFIFSNFSGWGTGHNNGFSSCVEDCKNKICFVDIGSHVGLVSMSAASVMPDKSKVISFEPALKNVDLLRKHVKLNNFSNKIYIENILLGEKNLDEVNFFQDKNPTGMNSIVKNKKVNLQLTKVKQVSLDFYLNKKKYKPDIIKIDEKPHIINLP